MSNYYAKQDAKVRMAHELMKMGWNVEGYKADESDSMTDYWSPAHWGGIATKNGFVLVVDNRYTAEAKEITKYNPAGNLSFEDREKIQKLEAITTERGATVGEEENAKALIEKIQSKTMDQPAYEVVGMTTAHMGNPKGSIWHIEKDGKIYDKGNALTKFADVPESWEFDINKMEYTDRYKKVKEWNNNTNEWEWVERKLPDETRKIINDFKALILRFERVVNGMNTMGDGTKETEEQAKEQQQKQGYEKITITETKTSIKPVEVTRKTIQLDDILSFKTMHGGYWKVIDIWQNSKGVNCYTYEILGSEKRGYQQLKNAKRYYQTEPQIIKAIEQGNIKIHTMQEVTEKTPVEKWVKIDKTQKSKNTYNSKQEKVQEEKQTTTVEQPEETTENKTTLNHKITITADVDTRDNSPLWVVKLVNKVDYEEFKRIEKEIMKPIKGYYSRFKGGFIFKYDPTSILKPEQQPEQTTTGETIEQNETTNPYEPQEIKDGFIYDCHFKEWDIPMEEIKEAVTALNISFIDLGVKIGFGGVTAEQARQLKEISDINGSIFFIDAEKAITADNSTTEEQPESEEVTEQQETETDNIIDFEEYKNNSEVEKMEINNNSNDFNFDDIINTFDNIEINNNSRISADDEEFCKKEQEQYTKAVNVLNKIREVIQQDLNIDIMADRAMSTQKSNNAYLDYYSFRELTDVFYSRKDSFIHNIITHFTNKYKITIDSYKVCDKYKKVDVDYNILLDEIFLQLGGFSFNEKAIDEIKQKAKTPLYYNRYRNYWNYEIKGKTIKFRTSINHIKPALYFYDNNETDIINCYTHNKIDDYKSYDNGNTDIKFYNASDALDFAKRYLGYTEMTDKEREEYKNKC